MKNDKGTLGAITASELVSNELVERIKTEHAACVTAASDSLSHALACGDLLTEVRRQTPHGEWERWVETNLPFAPRTARFYIQLAAHRETIEANRQHDAVMGLREAYRLIAPPQSKADEANNAAIEPDEAVPNVIPPPGKNLIFRCYFSDGMEAVYIERSIWEGYFYITVIRLSHDPEYGNVAQGNKRPFPQDHIWSTCVDYGAKSLVEKGERIEFANAEQLDFNHWLYDSFDHYLERSPIEEQRRAERSDGEIITVNPE